MYHVWMQSYLRQKVFVRTMKDGFDIRELQCYENSSLSDGNQSGRA